MPKHNEGDPTSLREVVAPLGRKAGTDGAVFHEVMDEGVSSSAERPWSLKDSIEQLSVEEIASADPDAAAFARGEAITLQKVVLQLLDIASQRNPAMTEFQTVALEDAAEIIKLGAREVMEFEVASPGRKGDLLFTVVDLILSVFDIGKIGAAATIAPEVAAATQNARDQLEEIREARSAIGKHAADKSVAIRQAAVDTRRQWIVETALRLIEETPQSMQPERLASRIEDMNWPRAIPKRAYSTILDDVRDLIREGLLPRRLPPQAEIDRLS